MTLRVASYNIHSCRGRDRAVDVGRVARVLAELRADVIALQEVDSRPERTPVDQFAYLPEALDMAAAPGVTVRGRRGGAYGNLVLSRLPVRAARLIDLRVPGREPRGAVDADLAASGLAPGGPAELRVIAAHFGLAAAERAAQAERVRAALAEAPGVSTVVLGDLNEWRPFSRLFRPWHAHVTTPGARRTFPSGFRTLALDRIFASRDLAFVDLRAHVSPLARVASDHLPILAELRLPVTPLGEAARAAAAAGDPVGG